MREIIDKIIQAELEAQQQGKCLEQQEAEFRESLAKEIEAYKSEKMELARERLEKVEQAESSRLREQIEVIESEYSEKTAKLNAKFEDNRESYLKTLFFEVTGCEWNA